MIVTLSYGTFEIPDTDAAIIPQLASEGFWDPELRPYLDRVQAGDLVIDVGAHVGLYSGYWASRGATVIALEAHPAYYSLLLGNIGANGWSTSL